MDKILSFVRDEIVGIPYFILVSISIFLIFAIIGYLTSLKYKSINNVEEENNY